MSIAATVGRPAITAIDTCIHDGFVVFSDMKVDQLFLYYLLKTIEPDWSQHGQTGSQMNINTMIIELAEVRIPPTSAEQAAIAEVLSDMDAEIQDLETRLEKARLVKEGMMQNLLTGRIRLV
jgi:type I restriction enzyme S subunit